MDLSEITNNNNRHPWELSRKDMIVNILKKLDIKGSVLDIGCGDGYFDQELIDSTDTINEIIGIDIEAKSPITNGKLRIVNNYEDINGLKFDYIIMMDVLEHIENDIDFLNYLHKFATDDTIFLFTVPALMSLFSEHDKALRHYRRYDFTVLKERLISSGFDIKTISFFYASLVILRCLSKNKKQTIGGWQYPEHSFLTAVIRMVLNIDFKTCLLLSSIGIRAPGLSLLAICKQNGKGK